MRRFSDFATEEAQLDGEKLKLDDLLDQEIKLTGFRIQDSKYSKNKSGKYATVQFIKENEGTKNVFFTGSDILIEQLDKYKDQLPFVATVKKINRYYTLS